MRGRRAAIYVRVSAADDEKVLGIEQQEANCRAHVRDMGYEVVDVFADRDLVEGDERPELKRMRSALWRRNFDIVIATRPDRLFRDTNRLVRMTREVESMGARIEFADLPLDFNPEYDEY